jgi:hypothetical protein
LALVLGAGFLKMMMPTIWIDAAELRNGPSICN